MEEGFISKTRRKKEMHALQDLGAELVALSADRLGELELPEALLEAVRAAQRLKGFEARRRQLQFIGRLMRDVDPAPIRARLSKWNGGNRAHSAWLHDMERWRERLLADPEAVNELAQLGAGSDLQHLRTLVRNARNEAAAGKPPKHFRALFQELKGLFPEPEPDDANAS